MREIEKYLEMKMSERKGKEMRMYDWLWMV